MPAPEPEIEDEAPIDDAIEQEETVDRGDEPEGRGDEVSEPEAEEEAPSADVEDEPDTEVEDEESEEVTAEPVANIPKSRFDEVNNKRHEAEEKIREMETRMAVMEDRQKRSAQKKEPEPEPFHFDGKEQAYMDAVLDGDGALAKGLRGEIRAAEREDYISEAQQMANTSGVQTREDLDFEYAANGLINNYAEFQKENEAYDQKRLDEVIELKDAFILSGMSAPAALNKAANITMRGVLRVGEESAAPTKKKTNVPKNLKTAKKQPPNAEIGESNGSTSDLPDISKMTDAELEALPKSKLAEMRGDFI